ncbi:hypothetical protein PHSY_004947 [Pseudozyma hubeiensis SY62]|uniref:Uncharacterized protein n=1 Tax=Pseudozyma hubeiensis (strain SY62) TaxID=1305764 RepID=R9P806_PSEHS|nr:hypothetical protein PHSY_004947 [Pseudozyma hubeiensis SY62]GAC97362.1 hypothetical protein PHSY_004947 [Pseudozyma hubeiensis SY62]
MALLEFATSSWRELAGFMPISLSETVHHEAEQTANSNITGMAPSRHLLSLAILRLPEILRKQSYASMGSILSLHRDRLQWTSTGDVQVLLLR